ncbi:UNVERIFIED_CONTAM: hypothetical protein Sradi_6917400 [Sesamum radiatum]|uniref:Reverse transcriptase domain-containing protein n=1 Tax=Sesamum radiatum TaxID=300843 RepID=A0AAW2JJP7_SESRA
MDCDPSRRRQLWGGLQGLADNISEVPWCVLGDFNATLDVNESCGRTSDSNTAMADFREFISNVGLVHPPFTGCPFTWHNCSEGDRSLWRRLDRALVNPIWFNQWPQTTYFCALPRTSDHSPIILRGAARQSVQGGIFRFDNVLAKHPKFLSMVQGVWRHHIHGTLMYGLVCKLKALKGPFRALRKVNGDLSDNVSAAKEFLDKAQGLLDDFKEDILLQLVQCCRVIYCKTVEMEATMLRQRAKMNWVQHGDQCSRLFFSRINLRRARQRVYQITSSAGNIETEPPQIAAEFLSFFQSLLGGRVIADNILLAQELLAGYNQAKLPQRCTIKVDIQKAYDSVNWDFLLESLRIFQFPSRFIDWIEQCVSTVAYSVLLNGSLHGFFSGSKGLRQGDPLSPYLFVIVMEIWHVMLRLRTQSDESFQYHWKCNDLGILNLCFADDVLIFCAGTINSVSTIKATLLEFAELSGLRVNPGKSTIILSKSVHRDRQAIIDLIGFQEGSLPIKYLGVPLSSSRLTRTDCQPLLDKLARRLAGWNHLTLSLAGRTQVIKSVLNSLHIYWASAFLLPKAIIQILERKMREFLWKGSSGSGYAKVSWAQILGIRGGCCSQAFLGPAITGLPADSFLRAVLHQGQWRWPADTHFDIQEIMAELPSIGPQQTDVIRWKPGNFSSQSVFSFLQPASPPVLWHQLLGGKFKIPRHDFILWLAVLERLSTMDRLWASRSDAGCMLCGGQILETHEHLFFECSFSKRCLDLLKHRVRFQWLRCGWHRDVIWASGRWRGKHLLNQAFRAVLASIVYYIWRERNNRRFSATASSAEAVVSRAVEEVRCRIISANCKPSLQLFVLYRIWKIPWARP